MKNTHTQSACRPFPERNAGTKNLQVQFRWPKQLKTITEIALFVQGGGVVREDGRALGGTFKYSTGDIHYPDTVERYSVGTYAEIRRIESNDLQLNHSTTAWSR